MEIYIYKESLYLCLLLCTRGGNGNPFQYSYLVNPMDREAW